MFCNKIGHSSSSFDNFIFFKKVLVKFAAADKDYEARGPGLKEVFVMGQSLTQSHLRGHFHKVLVTVLKIHHDGGWSVPEFKKRSLNTVKDNYKHKTDLFSLSHGGLAAPAPNMISRWLQNKSFSLNFSMKSVSPNSG